LAEDPVAGRRRGWRSIPVAGRRRGWRSIPVAVGKADLRQELT